MKFYSVLLLSFVLIGKMASADEDKNPKLFPITEIGTNWPQPGSTKIGFIDETGQIVIPPSADYLSMLGGESVSFAEGLQPVTVGMNTKWPPTSWGYLDTKGNFAIEPQFEGASSFSEGLAAVSNKKGGPPWGRGYIDHTGKYIIPPQFNDARPFIDGVAVVKKTGDWLWGCIDPEGKWIIPAQYPSIGSVSEGLICVGKYATPQASPPADPQKAPIIYGFIDKTGKQIIDFKFKDPSSFSEGLAAINEDSACGYIDKTGAYVIPPTFFMGWSFSEGLARVKAKDGKMSYINPHGEIVFSVPEVIWADPFSEGLADAAIRDSSRQRLYGYLDKTGKFVIPPQFIMAKPFRNGLALVSTKEENGYIDKTGNFVWKTKLPDTLKMMGR